MLYTLGIKWTLNSEISARHGVRQVDTSRMIRNLTFLAAPHLPAYLLLESLTHIHTTQHVLDSIIDGSHIELQPLGDAPNGFDTRIRFSDRFNLPINSSIHIPTFLLHPISERNHEARSVYTHCYASKN